MLNLSLSLTDNAVMLPHSFSQLSRRLAFGAELMAPVNLSAQRLDGSEMWFRLGTKHTKIPEGRQLWAYKVSGIVHSLGTTFVRSRHGVDTETQPWIIS